MRFCKLAAVTVVACAVSPAVHAAQYRAWGTQQPTRPVKRVSFHYDQATYKAGCAAGCDSAYAAAECGGTAGCECDPCCDVPCDTCWGCGPCFCTGLLHGVARQIGCTLEWLLCCRPCGTYYGETCCEPACDPCSAGTGGDNEVDLMPTPTVPAERQSDPFTDDTVSIVPGRHRTSVQPTALRKPASQPVVVRSAYAEPIRPRLTGAAAAHKAKAYATDAPVMRLGQADRDDGHGEITAPRPRVKKAAILESLKQAIQ